MTMGMAMRLATSAMWKSRDLVHDHKTNAECGLDKSCALRTARARMIDSAALGSAATAATMHRRLRQAAIATRWHQNT